MKCYLWKRHLSKQDDTLDKACHEALGPEFYPELTGQGMWLICQTTVHPTCVFIHIYALKLNEHKINFNTTPGFMCLSEKSPISGAFSPSLFNIALNSCRKNCTSKQNAGHKKGNSIWKWSEFAHRKFLKFVQIFKIHE